MLAHEQNRWAYEQSKQQHALSQRFTPINLLLTKVDVVHMTSAKESDFIGQSPRQTKDSPLA